MAKPMHGNLKLLWGGLVAGVVVFVWEAIAHAVLPLGETGIRPIPDEPGITSAIKATIKEPGLYFFPGIDRSKQVSELEQKAWEAKVTSGPTGILVVHPEGGEAMSPRQLGLEFGVDVIAGLLAALVLTQVAASYFGRVLVVGMMGAFGLLNISASYMIWYGFPADFTAAEAITQVVGWLLAGLALAAIVKPATEPPKGAALAT
jgi:hypothetical protein